MTNCANCGKPIDIVREGGVWSVEEWTHSLTGRTSCDQFARPADSRDRADPQVSTEQEDLK